VARDGPGRGSRSYPWRVRSVSASRVVEGPGIEVEQLWYDRSRWASWIDGFAHLSKLEGAWPLEGSRRMWVTAPGGRGLIHERVTAYAAGDGQTLAFEDEKVQGVQRVRFETDGVRTRITCTVELETKARLAPARRWWLRRQFRGALERSLARFSYELAAERALVSD
jgi:polyketide cyclase/dehydrase/lipid transport protein